ncbi:OmpA family protein [bacterium]|nr:OmpA family protein [bacterium]
MRTLWKYRYVVMALVLAVTLVGCEGCKAKKEPPVVQPPAGGPGEVTAPPPVRPSQPAGVEPIEIPEMQRVYFDYDKYDLRPDALAVLRNNLVWLRANPDKTVTIEGHCDERGSEQYNQVLGEKRANAVRGWLVQNGISADRLVTVSLGESQPEDPRHNEEAWAKNRRGVFKAWLPRAR